MFPHDYFAAGAFAPDYFPPAAESPVPPVPYFPSGGGRRWRRYDQPDLPVGPGDDEFWIWFT